MKDFIGFLTALIALAAIAVIVVNGEKSAKVASSTLEGLSSLFYNVESGGVIHQGA